MSATILIKRTQGTSPPTAAPVGTGVSFGELVYTYDVTNVGAGKSYKKLYIGDPSGNTAAPIPIGGEYYTQMLPDNPADFGKPTASKAVILNPSGQIVSWNVQTDLVVGSAATVSGDLTVGGQLNVTGDISYDEVTGRNIQINGIGTIATLGITSTLDTPYFTNRVGLVSAIAGVAGTYNDWNATSAQFEQINVSHATTTKNLTISGISTIENNYDFRTQLIRVGREAGKLETDGNDRQGMFIGNYAGNQAGLAADTKRNIAIGNSAFQKGGQTKAESNIFLGNFAGQEAEGSHNIYIGDKVGQDLGSQSVITYGETGDASSISFSDTSSLTNDPYAYRVYGTTDNFANLEGGDFAIAIQSLGDLGTINNAVTGNLSFNIGTCTNAHLAKLIGQQFTVKGQDNFALLTDLNDAIYLSTGSIGLTDTYGFLVVRAGITTNSGKEDHDQNIGIGREALWGAGISTNQSNNIAIGAFALYNVMGSDNVAIGNSAGANNTGNNNVIIGKGQDVRYPDQDDQLIIGSGDVKWVSGNSDGWVGIGTTTPTALLDVDGDVNITGVATIPQLDVNDIGIEDIKITAGLATDLAITYAKIQTGIITDQTGTAATITRADFVDVDVEDIKITVGLATDLAVTNLVNQVGIITNAYIDVGVVTSYVGTYSTISVVDIETLDAKQTNITGLAVTDTVGTAATITNVDFINADIEQAKIVAGLATDFDATYFRNEVGLTTNAYITVGVVTSLSGFGVTYTQADFDYMDAVYGKITAGVVTSLVSTYSTITDLDVTRDARVGGALTVTGNTLIKGNLDVEGTTSYLQSAIMQVNDKNIELGVTTSGSASDASASGGGITLKGTTDKTIEWDLTRGAWTVNQKFNPAADDTHDLGTTDREWKDIYIDGTAHLDAADILDAKITAGIITSQVGTYATITVFDTETADLNDVKVTTGIITSLVGTYATITTFDTETADLKDVKITSGIITDIVGTAATITTIDATEGDIVNAKITAGVVTSLVGTYATITTAHITTLSADNLSFTGIAVTDVVGTAATITTLDVQEGDIVNAKITAGVITSIVGTYATITTFDTETADLKDVKITSGIITDIVGTAASITTIDVSDLDALTAKINAGYITSLYDSTGVVGINTQHILSTDDAGTITWREPAQIGIATINAATDVWFVDKHGVDDNAPSRGRTDDRPFKTVAYALSRISNIYDHTFVSAASNAVNVQSGAESGNEKTPNGAVYEQGTGKLTLSFGSAHGLSTADTITLDNNSLTFTCSKDNNGSNHTYPRATDPIAGVTTAVTVINSTSFSLNVGKSPNIIGENEVLTIGGGVYEEVFPLTVPAGLTVKGSGLRATKIKPTTATKQKDGFLLNDRSVVEDLTIAEMYFNTSANEGFAFKFAPGIAVTARSPYVQRVTVFNKGSNVTATDPYGYNSADSNPSSYIAGAGAYIDGSEMAAGSIEAAMLFNEVTFIVPNSQGVVITNGARSEYLNAFTYFASEAIKGVSGSLGIHSAGKTRLRLTGITTVGVGNTVTLFDTDGTTGLGTAVVANYDGTYLEVTGKQTGFEVLNARTAKTVTFNDGAQLDTSVKKFGTASLKLDGTNDSISVPSSGDLGFGTNTDFTVEFWAYSNTTGLSSATLFDLRDNGSDTNGLSLAYRAAGEVDLRVGTTTAITGSGAGIATGVWKHYAIARGGTNTRLFVDGTQRGIKTSDTTDYGASKGLVIGADFDGASNNVTGWIDDFRVEYGVAKYTANFTAPTAELTGDKDTRLLLNFNGANGISTTTDNIVRNQDIRITQAGGGIGTATKVILADYSQFGADMRSVGCAVEYGQKGVIADGEGVSLRMFALNFNQVGAGADITNDPNLAIQANEVTEVNNGDVSYVSIDQRGDFRVGEAFFVDQENGTVSFSQQVTSLQALSSLVITDGSNNSTITPNSGTFGNIQIAGNSIESTSGDINIDPAGAGDINITGDVNILGILTATVIQLDAFQKNDTSIALDDSGSDGTIRFNTDNVEGMRLDANQKLGIGTASPRDRLDVLDTAQFERVNITGVSTYGGDLDINADVDISSNLNVTGVSTFVDDIVIGVAGTVGFATDGHFADSANLTFGHGQDLKIYHTGDNSYIRDDGTGQFIIQSDNYISLQKTNGENLANFITDSRVELFHDNTKRLETTDYGVYVSDTLKTRVAITTNAFIDVGVVTSLTGTAATITTIDVTNLDVLDAKINAGLATNFAITNARIQTGIATEMTFAGFSTFVGIATFQQDVFVAGNLNVIGDVYYDEVQGRNLNVTGISTLNLTVISGVATISDIKIGAGSSSTKIETNSGELVLDSASGQVTIQDNFNVVGYATFKNGLYYRSDQGGSTGIGYSGPNGMGYFEADGRLVSTASTVGFLTTSNYVMTTNAAGVPTWSDSIDGGFF